MLLGPSHAYFDEAVTLLCSDQSGPSLVAMRRRDAELIAKAFEFRVHKAGDVIAEGGKNDTDRFAFMVIEGEVRALIRLPGSSSDVVAALSGPGALSGLGHLFSDGPRVATYEVPAHAVIAVLQRHRLAQLLQDHPRAAALLMSKMGASYHVFLQGAVRRYLLELQTARSLAAELERQAIDDMPHFMRLAAFGSDTPGDSENAPHADSPMVR